MPSYDRELELKLTRILPISDLVFTSVDLRRIAKIIDLQEKSDAYAKSEYVVNFADKAMLESDTPEVFSEESLTAPARPIKIGMSFHDYSANHHISLSVDHGDSSYGYGNQAIVSSTDQGWLSENFLALKDALERTRPQSFWFRRHRTLLLNLIAIGIGNLGTLLIHLLLLLLDKLFGFRSSFGQPAPDSSWQAIQALPTPVFFVLDWLWRWALGFTWGAFAVRRWLLAMWPSIEFDFGLPHLLIEKNRRTRLRVVGALVIVPIITAILYDLLKLVW